MKGYPISMAILCLVFTFLVLIKDSHEASEMSVYWGQNTDEGGLAEACSSDNYEIVNIGFLSTFASGGNLSRTSEAIVNLPPFKGALVSGMPENMAQAWNNCAGLNEVRKIYMSLPASNEAARSGYIAPDELINKVLPNIKTSTYKYGGVALWSRQFDDGFSRSIKPHI